jgi:hypothetical protein
MYKLIGIDPSIPGSPTISGYVESETQYLQVFVTGDEIIMGKGIDKSKYKSYEHFAAVMGKFNPEVIFFRCPIPLSELSRVAIEEAERQFNAI